MFIPPGKPVHENLASSFVILDALIDDLCEGGFTGIIEVILRDTDCHVIVNRGRVAAVTERRAGEDQTPATVAEIAAEARRERGRISVYSYAVETAAAVAGRLGAAPLYSRLSTEFADPEKMIQKLRREKDREWFVEIDVNGGATGLVHIADDRCFIVSSHPSSSEADHEAVLSELLRECQRAGGVFDVYFKEPGSQTEEEPVYGAYPAEWEQAVEADSTGEPGDEFIEELQEEAVPENGEQFSFDISTVAVDGVTNNAGLGDELSFELDDRSPLDDSGSNLFFGAESDSSLSNSDVRLALASPEEDDQGIDLFQSPAGQVFEANAAPAAAAAGQRSSREDALELAEVKRLMGEVARTVESATRPGEGRDSFSMSLKSGQLKVADRYPFLDPFGSEFEYHAGEIAFVGSAEPAQFVAGLAEAIRYAIINMAEASNQPAKLLARVEEDLRRLLEGRRDEFEPHGLVTAIEQIIARAG